MSFRLLLALCSAFGIAMGSMCWAAGSGAGAGGSGHQRAINRGLPPGEPGPPGAVNNRRTASEATTDVRGATRPTTSGKGQ